MKKNIAIIAAMFMSAGIAQAAEVAPGLDIGGEFFLGVNQTSINTGVTTTKTRNIALDRAIVDINYKIDPVWSARIAVDFARTGPGQDNNSVVKYAYIQAKTNDMLALRIGSSELPIVANEDSIWGLRYISAGINDKLTYVDEADWGIHALGQVELEDVTVGYAGSAVIGSGYKNFTGSTSTTDTDYEAALNVSNEFGKVAVGYRNGRHGDLITPGSDSLWTIMGVVGMEGYKVGGEFSRNNTRPAVADSRAWSVFGSAEITDKVGLFARYDKVDPNRAVANDYVKTTIFGASVDYNKNISTALTLSQSNDDATSTRTRAASIDTVVRF